MTPREIVQRIARLEGYDNDARAERIIQQAMDEEVGKELDLRAEANAQMIRDAVAQERERCARIADNWPGDAGAYIAKAIREEAWLIEDPPVPDPLPD